MAKRDPTRDALERLSKLDLRSPEGEQALLEALSHKSNLVVARAAKKIEQHRLQALAPNLVTTLTRLFDLDANADKGCEAKTALARALCELEVSEQQLYARGVRLRQIEAAYGGPVDTAAEVRGLCAVGLVRSHRRDVLEDLAILLADPEPVARSYAARAVVENGETQGAALLLSHLLRGEEVGEVALECLTGLFALGGARAVDYIRSYFLTSPADPVWPMALLALGESRRTESLALLLELHPRLAQPEDRRALLEAIAITRLEAAREFLAEQADLGSTEARETLQRFWG
ncbi:MAG: hypothetical protein AB7S38_22135 [Vulcanimicrobiota bacterium]